MKFEANPSTEDLYERRGMCPPVHLTADRHIIIGNIKIPTEWVELHGITVKAGDTKQINRLVVTFFVGNIEVDDEIISEVVT